MLFGERRPTPVDGACYRPPNRANQARLAAEATLLPGSTAAFYAPFWPHFVACSCLLAPAAQSLSSALLLAGLERSTAKMRPLGSPPQPDLRAFASCRGGPLMAHMPANHWLACLLRHWGVGDKCRGAHNARHRHFMPHTQIVILRRVK